MLARRRSASPEAATPPSCGLTVQQPTLPLANLMGADLVALVPTIRNECIFPAFVAVSTAVATKTPPGDLAGFTELLRL